MWNNGIEVLFILFYYLINILIKTMTVSHISALENTCEIGGLLIFLTSVNVVAQVAIWAELKSWISVCYIKHNNPQNQVTPLPPLTYTLSPIN